MKRDPPVYKKLIFRISPRIRLSSSLLNKHLFNCLSPAIDVVYTAQWAYLVRIFDCDFNILGNPFMRGFNFQTCPRSMRVKCRRYGTRVHTAGGHWVSIAGRRWRVHVWWVTWLGSIDTSWSTGGVGLGKTSGGRRVWCSITLKEEGKLKVWELQ